MSLWAAHLPDYIIAVRTKKEQECRNAAIVYKKLPDKITNPDPLLGMMRTRRQAMIGASTEVKA